MSKHKLAAIVGAVATVAAGSAAFAAIPDGGGVIHGCYAKSGGTLRVIDSSTTNCKSGETSLNWNQQGLKGDKGDTGEKGDKGEKGDPGPPGPTSLPGVATAAVNDYGLPNTSKGASPATITTLDLPAGDYLLFVTGWVQASNLADHLGVGCYLKVSGTMLADAHARDDDSTTQSIAMQAVATANAPSTAALVCESDSDHNYIDGVRLTALQVQL